MTNGETDAGKGGHGDSVNRIVLVTGVSGAGRSTALKSFEDLGYEAVDNLPLTLLESVVLGGPADRSPLAVGVDIRTRDFGVESVISGLDRLLASGKVSVTLLFLDCEDDVLVRRYTLALLITSFSYRYGLPREADLVFDARFLANPHYDPALRDMTGRDKPVGDFIARDESFPTFLEGLGAMLSVLLPRYEKEGKSYLTIAVGCTGGRHRSVYVAERLGKMLGSDGRRVHLTHRDIQRGAGQDTR
jgi:UPF0042 nucleotide-binding protein